MKKLLIIGLLFYSLFADAQNNYGKADDAARIALTTYVPMQAEGFTVAAKSNLESKLSQIATKAGMGGKSGDRRFIITANVAVITKDITPTAPPLQAFTLEVTLYIGDGIDGKLFSSTSVTLKGVGETETKAYMSALKNLKVDDPSYQKFIEDGKRKIIEYYNANCDFILKEAQTKASNRNFDEALQGLSGIPPVTKDCYDKAMDLAADIYKQKIELECQQSISGARTLMAQNKYDDAAALLGSVTPDLKCYSDAKAVIKEIADHRCSVSLGKAKGAWATLDYTEAANHLADIPSDSKCATEAVTLANEISKRAKEVDKRDWQYKLKVQQDNVDIEKQRIRAARDIGVAYGQNQPKVVYNIRGWW
jgi:hypothetical protein